VTSITYPDLPISERREEILEAIATHQVVVISGETGSGKSTQLPKMCLELGRGIDSLIGHTQPRRIAARSVAERIAEELGTTIGDRVGYAVRFNDRVGPKTQIKVMTDGLLLAEVQRDRNLTKYDTIIIDEAHERGLNIDFLLGYLHRLLPRRQDLKLIITSATIDTQRFADHFEGADVIEVSGRGFPVEMRYRPLDDPEEGPRDQSVAIADAVEELVREGPGDILVFCSGEREIRDAAETVQELKLPSTEVFPLYARLSSDEQHRVFEKHTGRRVVIATNVAETSLTVPGIRYVVDPGTARISRYSQRTKVQRLPIEPVSQASANQRAGRCGRVAPGVCIRLYSEDDYESRPEFTEPEIKRTNLASVLLQMAALRLGDPAAFPFVDPPDLRSIRDGIALLEELDAVDPDKANTKKWLTPLGRQLARLPLDPRLGRMVLEAADNGCVHEVMVIASGLSIQDPRERPTDKREIAQELHKRFVTKGSDLLSFLELWNHIETERAARSSNQFRKMCRAEYLNYLRIREWQDIYAQLRRELRQLNIDINTVPATPDAVHMSLLAGLLSHIGYLLPKKDVAPRRGPRQRKEMAEYQASRNARFAIARDSALAKSTPTWVMAAELVETNRLWARGVAKIEPEWAERLADHLTTRSYSEPTWDELGGSAVTTERVTLYGLPIVSGRRIQLGRVDAELARQMFIHHALVDGDVGREWVARHAFMSHNRAVIAEVDSVGARARRSDLVADRAAVHDFYDSRLGLDVTSAGHFNRWWKSVRRKQPTLLDMTVGDLIDEANATIDAEAFPESWQDGEVELAVSYEFNSSSSTDGVIVTIPVEVVNQLDPSGFDWSVPGHRRELVTALIRSLPKLLRKHFVPVPDTADAVLDSIDPTDGGVLEALCRELSRVAGVAIPVNALDLTKVPDHLRPTLRVVDGEGGTIAEGKDLRVIRNDVREAMLDVLASTEVNFEQTSLTDWTIGTVERTFDTIKGGHTVRGYPALVDMGDSVSLRLLSTPSDQAMSHWSGTRRLVRFRLSAPVRQLDAMFSNATKLALAVDTVQSKSSWYHDVIDAAIDSVIEDVGGPPWDRAGYEQLVESAREQFDRRLRHAARASTAIIDSLARTRRTIDGLRSHQRASQLHPSVIDAEEQLGRLTYSGFVSSVGLDRLADIDRYVRSIEYRLLKLPERVTQDQRDMLRCRELEADHARLSASSDRFAEVEAIGWRLQEFRVNVFAQPIGAAEAVSEKRLRNEIRRAHGVL
jgi:ATP-dependent helicase HrpA